MFESRISHVLDGYVCADHEDMKKLWPSGYEAAKEILRRFLHTKARFSQVGDSSPLADGAEISNKASRIREYAEGRNCADKDSSSRLSPYLAAGVISARECVRETMRLLGRSSVEGTKANGVGIWVQELGS